MTLIEPNDASVLAGTLPEVDATSQRDRFPPGQTVRIPLADDETMLRRMHRKTRHHVHLAQRRGVNVVRHPAGQLAVGALHRLIEEAARRNGSEIHSPAYYEDFLHTFGDDAVLLFAKADDGALAAALVTARFGNEAITMFGGSSAHGDGHRAAVLLQFEAMRWAREMGCGTYDLRGILNRNSERPGTDEGRWLSWFENGFGGEIPTCPLTIERRHVPVLPWLARTLKRIER
jgi:lipid II:glycine glycyltransferase (peptidoglycan interpeptide bridge formation enzyme)